PFAITADLTGNAIVTGMAAQDPIGNVAYETIKYAGADGQPILQQTSTPAYTGARAVATALAADSEGNGVVPGASQRGDTIPTIYTVKYRAADGALLWEQRHDASVEERAVALALDSQGNVAVVGLARATQPDPDFYTAKYAAADGHLLWEQTYDD